MKAAEPMDAGAMAAQCDGASPEPCLVEQTPVRNSYRCPTCDDLERGRKQAAAARDPSKVTDFDGLIARHRARHGAGS
ncbi:hypothetical protein Stsp01_32650 [Streptomyces sp. NBRC 13847]|nr:hypothetical protein Stsp01_32650 [Streptomyces sp. NBRC 13847]